MTPGRHAVDLEHLDPCAGVLDRPVAGTPGRTPVEVLARTMPAEVGDQLAVPLLRQVLELREARDTAVLALQCGVTDEMAREAAHRLLTGRELALVGDRP